MTKPKSLLVFSVLGLLVIAVQFYIYHQIKNSDDPKGFITQGHQFGIEIGESQASVTVKLANLGLVKTSLVSSPQPEPAALNCHGFTYDNDFEVHFWFDKNKQNNIICAAFKGQKLERLSWDFETTTQ